MLTRNFCALFLLLAWLPSLAFSQYFARNSVQLPSLGTMALAYDEQWGLRDSLQIGTGYARDLVDLHLWWINETAVGFSRVSGPSAPSSRIAITVQGSTGLKYNFLTERWRPFAGFMIEIFQIFNAQPNPYLPSTIGSYTWASARPMVGLEWLFSDDMSFEGQVGYIALINFEDPVRHSAMTRFAYRLYF